MIKNFVKILELLGDRLEVCVSVYVAPKKCVCVCLLLPDHPFFFWLIPRKLFYVLHEDFWEIPSLDPILFPINSFMKIILKIKKTFSNGPTLIIFHTHTFLGWSSV